MHINTIWLNGEFYEGDKAVLSAAAAGNLLGWGVFTTLGIRAGRPLLLERHIARLHRDAARLGIECPFSEEAVQSAVMALIARNSVETGTARLTLTQSGDGRWRQAEGSDLLIIAHNAQPLPLWGWRVQLSPFRFDARRPLAGVKSTSHADYLLAGQHAKNAGFDDAILCNQTGALSESTRSNLFWVRNGALYTPSLESGCLPGIAREIMLEVAAEQGIALHQGLFSVQELSSADEIFLTAATTGPRSVAYFEAHEMGEEFPSPGPLTTQFQQWWIEAT